MMLPLWILFLLVSFGSVGAVLFTPALPSIQAFFQVSIGEAQLTVTSYLIGYALGQLPYGPLANGIGRKKTLYLGVFLSIVGSLLCAVSSPLHSFGLLVFARFIQALGACVGLKVSFTMIADIYDQTNATRAISKIFMAFAIMPGIAIAIGGFITQFSRWDMCFYFLACFGFFILFLISKLPETAREIDSRVLNINAVLKTYRAKLKDRHLVLSGLIMGCGTAVVYVFASKAPFIGMNLMGMTPKEFGLFNLIPPLGMLAGFFLSIKLAGKFAHFMLLQIGIIASLIAAFIMFFCFAVMKISGVVLFFPMVLIYAAEALVFANISSFGLAEARDKSNASAMLNFLNMGAGCVAVFLSEWLFPASALFLPIVFVVLFLIMLFLYGSLKKS